MLSGGNEPPVIKKFYYLISTYLLSGGNEPPVIKKFYNIISPYLLSGGNEPPVIKKREDLIERPDCIGNLSDIHIPSSCIDK